MSLYKVAIVGRANVGKSSLFNRICRKNIAIVHEKEGVTLDRIYHTAYFENRPFVVIDTAGLETSQRISYFDQIYYQTQIAIDEADALIMVVDFQVGITDLDEKVAKNLLKIKKRIILAVNKVDDIEFEEGFDKFYKLGIKDIIDISCSHNRNIDDLVNLTLKDFVFDENYKIEMEKSLKVAIVGRTNVGKSTLLNALLNKKRAVVSDTISTTRDSIDSDILIKDKIYKFIDTAGIRRKKKERDVLEKFSHFQALKNIERADICLLMLDALDCLTAQDKKILKFIEEKNKGIIILINKWDLIKNVRQEHFLKAINQTNYPTLIISAIKKLNLNKIFQLIDEVEETKKKFIQTAVLNKFIEKCLKKYHPPVVNGKRLKIYYLTQIKKKFPYFLFFVNNPRYFSLSYKRYLMNNFRNFFDFKGIPITFCIKSKPKQ